MSKKSDISSPGNFLMLRAMVGIGALCGLLIVSSYEITLPRIERLRAEALQEAIFKVIPGITQTRAFTYENGAFVPANEESHNRIYAGYDSVGVFKGIAINASGQGYADVIKVLYGYDPEKERIIGFYVLESKETPGLGDKIEKDPVFLENFSAMMVELNEQKTALVNRIVTVKSGSKSNSWEVDGITGATISSRAIGDIIAKSAEQWMPAIYQHKDVFKEIKNE